MAVSPVRALYDVFFARFFENETTVGRTDLRQSLLWLIGCLAAPGVFWGFWQSFRWSLIAMMHGEAALRVAVLFDKTLYLAFTAVAIGLVACIAWPSLVIDRRDALILGVWPVRLRSIVTAKLTALLGYIGVIAGGMHAASALMFGTLLGSGSPISTARAVAGHFVAATALSLLVFGGLAALATILLAVLGPRRFLRISGIVQLACIGIVTTAVLLLPAIAGGATGTMGGRGRAAPWILDTPQMWFLGLYEIIAGFPRPGMADLAWTGVGALAAVLLALVVCYPIACGRVLAATSQPVAATSRPWSRALSDLVVRLTAWSSETRATLQFVVATIGRLQQHRLLISIALGIAMTICIPILLSWLSPTAGGPKSIVIPLLAIGPTLLFFVAAGLRVAMALPAELPARWVFVAAPTPVNAGRIAARRLMFVAAALPSAMVTGAIAFALWGAAWAIGAAAIVALAGVILVDVHLWGFTGVPCARPLAPGSAKLQSRWPLYLTGLYLTSVQLPHFLAAAHARAASGWLLAAVLPLAIVVRIGSDRAAAVNAISDLDDDSLLLLDLSVPAPQKVTNA